LVTYGFGELDALVPAYAASIHKSQLGIPAVVIPVMTRHNAMPQRNLLYTGVTRGKRLVVLVGQKKPVAIAVRPTALVEAVAEHGLSRRYVSA
jgi:exodeoxyribonuclease V alpha subunit